jgi:hypothetical protein
MSSRLYHATNLAHSGEEVVTKESFISICWRLIPYWLNNWEQQWGAECSSMMFELPHFAVELLVILPCVQVSACGRAHPHACGWTGVGRTPRMEHACAIHACDRRASSHACMHPLQIICSRMKILAMPLVNLAAPAGAHQQAPQGFVREHFAPNILKGFWEHRPEQKSIMLRLRWVGPNASPCFTLNQEVMGADAPGLLLGQTVNQPHSSPPYPPSSFSSCHASQG